MGRLFLCCLVLVREGFAPEGVAQLGHGGFLMLGYQKSSAAAPKPLNWFRFGVFLAGVSVLAGASRIHTRLFVVVTQLACQ
jgi:hypothetical protein